MPFRPHLKLPTTLPAAGRFVRYVTSRFFNDRCLQMAASLTYTSLLALVPLLAVGLAMISAFPIFGAIRSELQHFIFANLVPEVGTTVEQYVERFITNTDQLTTFGIVGLGVTAVMLLATIEEAFNEIWHVDRERALTIRLMRFWAALTLGPLLLALGFNVPRYLLQFAGLDAANTLQWTTGLAAPLIEMIGFSLLYFLIPNRPVRIRHALFGGIAAMVMFELIKLGFSLYIGGFGTYQTIYGALAALPILLLWVYLVWLIVLLGAEFTASLPAWRHAAEASGAIDPARQLGLALELLAVLWAAHRQGGGVAEHELHDAVAATPADVDELLRRLAESRYAAAAGGGWILARDLRETSLDHLCRHLGFGLDAGALASSSPRWQDSRVAAVLAESTAGLRALSVAEALDEDRAALGEASPSGDRAHRSRGPSPSLRPAARARDRDAPAGRS